MNVNEVKEKKKNFITKALSYLNHTFELADDIHQKDGKKELILSTYMTMFSKIYDDREEINKNKEETEEIIRSCYIPAEEKTNSEVGHPYFSEENIAELKEIYENKGKDEYKKKFCDLIVSYTRNAVMHGSFIINNDATITVWQNYMKGEKKGKEQFKIVYEFDCLIDICEKLKGKTELEEYEKLINNLKGEETKGLDEKGMLLYFDLLSNLLIAYNEDFAHSNIGKFNDLYGTALDSSEIGHIRNSVAHGYREYNEGKIKIIDYKDKEKSKKTAQFDIDVNEITKIGKSFSFIDIDNDKESNEMENLKE